MDTNGAAVGCEDFYRWCQEVSSAQWVANKKHSTSPCISHALRFPGMARGGVQRGRPKQSIRLALDQRRSNN